MSSYLKSEFYRILHYKWTYLFIGICSVLLVSSNILLAVVGASEATFRYANTSFALYTFISNIGMVFIISVSVASLIFGNEHVNHTMKNSISYGTTRGTIYFCKLIVEIVYAIIAFVIITALYVLSAYLLLEHSNLNEFYELLRTCFVSLPLLLFALAATNCFVFIIESTGAATAAVIGFLLAFPMICTQLGNKFKFFQILAEHLPFNMINNIKLDFNTHSIILPWEGNTGYLNYWIYGLLQMAIIMMIGYIVFRKKEIK